MRGSVNQGNSFELAMLAPFRPPGIPCAPSRECQFALRISRCQEEFMGKRNLAWILPDCHSEKREKRHGYEEPSPCRGFYSDGDCRGCGLVCNGGCGGAGRLAARIVELVERQSWFVGRYGAANRESIWSEDGYAHADAVGLRDCPGTKREKLIRGRRVGRAA